MIYDLWFCLGWKLQLDKYQGFNAFPAKGHSEWSVTTEIFLVNRNFPGIKPADFTTLPIRESCTVSWFNAREIPIHQKHFSGPEEAPTKMLVEYGSARAWKGLELLTSR